MDGMEAWALRRQKMDELLEAFTAAEMELITFGTLRRVTIARTVAAVQAFSVARRSYTDGKETVPAPRKPWTRKEA